MEQGSRQPFSLMSILISPRQLKFLETCYDWTQFTVKATGFIPRDSNQRTPNWLEGGPHPSLSDSSPVCISFRSKKLIGFLVSLRYFDFREIFPKSIGPGD